MAENMMCSNQKATNKKFRDNYDNIFDSFDAKDKVFKVTFIKTKGARHGSCTDGDCSRERTGQH